MKQLSNCSLPNVASSDIFEHKGGRLLETPRVVYFHQTHDFYTVEFIPEVWLNSPIPPARLLTKKEVNR
jgi:hypothetical protein